MTKALILAGGLGTRLRPLTYTRPKPLLPIANRPHLEHVLDLLQRHGIDEVVLLTSYLADAFAPFSAEAERRGMQVDVTHEPEPLGTGGALRNAAEFIGEDTFFAFNGDVVTDADLSTIEEFHRSTGAEATLMLTPVEDPSAYGVVTTDGEGRVTAFVEKPPRQEAPTNLINAGVYVMEPRVIDRIEPGRPVSSEHEVFPQLVVEGSLFALAPDAYWNEIGDPAKYLQANLDALDGSFSTSVAAEVGQDRVLSDDGVVIADGAQVSSCCLGRDVRVGADAVIRSSVLLPRVHVAAGAHVEGCVLGEGVYIGEGTRIVDETVGDEQRVEA